MTSTTRPPGREARPTTRIALPSWTAAALRSAAWAPTSVFLLHLALSFATRAYVAFPYLDVPMHLLGGVAIAYFFGACLAELLGPAGRASLPRPIEPILLASLTAAAAVLWEFAEYLADALIGTRAQLGLEDTLLDMACGIAGGMVYLVAARRPALGADRARTPGAEAAVEPLVPPGEDG